MSVTQLSSSVGFSEELCGLRQIVVFMSERWKSLSRQYIQTENEYWSENLFTFNYTLYSRLSGATVGRGYTDSWEKRTTQNMYVALRNLGLQSRMTNSPVFWVIARRRIWVQVKRWSWQYDRPWRPWGGVEVWFYSFFNLAALTPGKKPGTYFTGGWLGLRTGLDGSEKSRPHGDSISGPSSPQRVAIPTLFCLFLCILSIFLRPNCPGFYLLSVLYNTHNTNIHALGGIRTRNPSKRSAADPRLKPFGHTTIGSTERSEHRSKPFPMLRRTQAALSCYEH